jgi:hypothetical protein
MGSNRKYFLWLFVLIVLYFLFKRLHVQNWMVSEGSKLMESATTGKWVVFALVVLLIVGGSVYLVVRVIEGSKKL